MPRCPGQDQRFWKPDDIFEMDCPHCGAAVEMWKDEPSLKCPKCSRLVINPKLDLGCAEWCQYAEQCLAAAADEESILCKRLIREVKILFGRDDQRLDRTLRVFRNAQQILEGEDEDARLVNPAAILHDVDDPQESEAPSVVGRVLFKCGVDSEDVERISKVIAAYRTDAGEDSTASRILQDAVSLATVDTDLAGQTAQQQAEFVASAFKTHRGRELAAGVLAGLSGNRGQ